jgi:superfamily II DNA or RNA helicase/intein/homing endonuclease
MTVVIQRNYVNCKLEGDIPQKTFQRLRRTMRYPIQGYRPSFVAKYGDGFKYLITPKRRIFPAGLLYMVIKILKEEKIEHSIIDLRTEPTLLEPILLNAYKLRDYQEDMFNACIEHKSGIVRAATGAGKTAVICRLIGHYNGLKRAIYVRKLDLMRQTIKVLERELDIPIGSIGGGEVNVQDTSVVMIPTAARALGEKYVKYTGHDNDDEDDPIQLNVQQKQSIKEYIENVDCLVVDECFPANTIIQTEDGPQRIGALVNQHYTGKVWSFNSEKNSMELKPVSNWYKRTTATPLCRVKIHPTKRWDCVTCTENHKFYVLDGTQIEAKKLKAGDVVRTFLPFEKRGKQNSSSKARRALNDDQMQVALGSVLGDGCLYPYKSQKVARLQFTHCEEQEKYCKWKLSIFGCEDKMRLQRGGYGDRIQQLGRTYGWWQLKVLRCQAYQNGKKVITRELLDQLKPLGIAVWVMDDGSWAPKSETYTLHTEGYSYEEQKIIQQYFKEAWQLTTTIRYNKNKDKYFLYFRKESSALLRKIISPHLHPSMSYKGGMRDIPFQEANKVFLPYGLVEVHEVEKDVQLHERTKDGKHCVFNITVDDNHNYIANGFLVSNCHCLASQSVQMISKYSKKAYYRLGFCVAGDSIISTEWGAQKIEDLYKSNYKGRVWSYNEHRESFELQEVDKITKKPSGRVIYQIQTSIGSTLRATIDHPILTDSGYKQVKDLNLDDWISVAPYLPEHKAYNFDKFYSEHRFTTYDVEQIKKDSAYRMVINEKKNDKRNRATKRKVLAHFGKVGNFDAWWTEREVSHICRFVKRLQSYNLTEYDIGFLFGVMLGDGHLRKDGGGYAFLYTSNKVETALMASYLSSYGIPFSQYHHQGEWTPNDTESDCEQIKISGVLPRFFAEIDFPLGKKTNIEYRLPSIIKMGNKDIKIGFLRGLFFADGILLKHKKYKSIEIRLSQNKDKQYEKSLRSFFKDVRRLLSDLKFKSSLSIRKDQTDCCKIKATLFVLGDSLKEKTRFLREIGFWGGPKQEKGYRLYQILQGRIENVSTSDFYEKVQRITECRTEPVYDIINVSSNYNFVANNIVVHNSATPYRSDGTDILLNAATGPRIYDLPASTLIKRGFLVPPRVHFYRVPRDWKKYPRLPADYQSLYTKLIVEHEARNEKIVYLTDCLIKNGERPVILVQRQTHGKILEEMLNKKGHLSKFIYGESSMTERAFSLDQFEAGTLDVLIGSSLPYGEKILVKDRLNLVKLLDIGEFIERFISGPGQAIIQSKGYKVLTINDQHLAEWKLITGVHKHINVHPIVEATTEGGMTSYITSNHSMIGDGFTQIQPQVGEKVLSANYVPLEETKREIDVVSELLSNVPSTFLSRIIVKVFGITQARVRKMKTDLFFFENPAMIKDKGTLKRAQERVRQYDEKYHEFLKWYFDNVQYRRGSRGSGDYFCTLQSIQNLPFNLVKYIKNVRIFWKRGSQKYSLPLTLSVDKFLARLCGYFCSEGCSGDFIDKRGYGRGCIHWAADIRSQYLKKGVREDIGKRHKRRIRQDIVECCQKVFGIVPNQNRKGIKIDSHLLFVFWKFCIKCGGKAPQKRVPDIVYNISEALRKEFLFAYFQGDGHLDIQQTPNKWESRQIIFTTSSREMTIGILYVLRSIGYKYVSVRKTEKEEYNRRSYAVKQLTSDRYTIVVRYCNFCDRIPLSENQAQRGYYFKEVENTNSVTIKTLSLQEGQEFVYDISVEGVERFIGGMGHLLHNSILQEGVDIPCITALINAGGGKSPSAYYQKIGRAIRLNDGKTRAIVIDFIDEVKWLNKHSKERIKVLRTEPLYQIKIQGEQ